METVEHGGPGSRMPQASLVSYAGRILDLYALSSSRRFQPAFCEMSLSPNCLLLTKLSILL